MNLFNILQSFKEIQQEQNFGVDRGSEAFMAIKELARRFSLSFGLDQLKNREAVAAMHKYETFDRFFSGIIQFKDVLICFIQLH